jgi:hypothetical protein
MMMQLEQLPLARQVEVVFRMMKEELTHLSSGTVFIQIRTFRNIAIESLKYKHWTHGEILYDFTIKQNTLHASIQFESNYNLASLSLKMG